jgi:sigma-B regulation protein RsbU (phosphoserine phosphatase)
MQNPFGCVELWAGYELSHRHVELAGLEGDVIAVPAGSQQGGDLYALFACAGEHAARIILADCVGHGFPASAIAARLHELIHRFRGVRNSSGLLAALNDEFTLEGEYAGAPLRLRTVVTATFDRDSGEFNYAYAAHPRIMLWRARERRWHLLGEKLGGLPIGYIAGALYTEQSIRLEAEDVLVIVSDGATDVFSPEGQFLGPEGLLEIAHETMAGLSGQFSLHGFAEALVRAIRRFHGAPTLEDDLSLLVLRRRQA